MVDLYHLYSLCQNHLHIKKLYFLLKMHKIHVAPPDLLLACLQSSNVFVMTGLSFRIESLSLCNGLSVLMISSLPKSPTVHEKCTQNTT